MIDWVLNTSKLFGAWCPLKVHIYLNKLAGEADGLFRYV